MERFKKSFCSTFTGMGNENYRGWLEAHPFLHSLERVVGIVHPLIHQGSRPIDGDLLAKIGLSAGESIFFYAGYHGDWASAIGSLGCSVTYSDLSQGLVNMMRHDPRSRHFSDIMVANGAAYPQSPFHYDWSVTFEPVPMAGHKTLYDALARSLLNSKGGKLIFRASKRDIYSRSLARLSDRYGVVIETSPAEIASKRKFGIKKIPLKYTVHTILTNDAARVEVLKIISEADLKTPSKT